MRNFKCLGIWGWVLILPLIWCVQSCAIQGAGPIGGPKDTIAPKCILMEPANGTKEFKDKRITLTFNEYVNVVNPYKQIIITPTLPANPEIISSRKKVIIDFGKIKLDSNTTYSIQFGKSIVDNNESNQAKEIHYVFSTGNYIDSLQLKGKVIDALTQRPVEKLKVFLYKAGNDSAVLKSKPLYYAETKSSGEYTFTNLPKGSYSVYAVEDKNESMHLEDGESVGFYNTPVKMDSNYYIKDPLQLYHYENPFFSFKSIRITTIQGQVRFSNGPDSLVISCIGSGSKVLKLENDAHDSVTFWPGHQKEVFKGIRIVAWSKGKRLDTTVNNVLQATVEKKVFERKDANVSGDNLNKYGTPFAVKLQKPVYRFNPLKFVVTMDTLKFKKIEPQFLDSTHTLVGLRYNFNENTFYRVLMYPGAIEDINGNTNKDTLNQGVSLPVKRQFGYIEVVVRPKEEGQYIFQLVDDKGQVAFSQSVSRETKIAMSYVSPGNYRLRMVKDLNKNGRWDVGNFFTKVQPEPVYYYPEPVNIRANWDIMDLVFDLNKLK